MEDRTERIMDMPIYLHLLGSGNDPDGVPLPPTGPRQLWYVIEEMKEKAAGDEVRRLQLPHLDLDVLDAAFAVSKSRLFFIGGFTWVDDLRCAVGNGILHIDLNHSLRWERSHHSEEHIEFAREAEASDDGNFIYVLCVDRVYRFPCDDVKGMINYPPPNWPGVLLAISGSTMLLYASHPDRLAYYNLENGSLDIINHEFTTGRIFEEGCFCPSLFCRTVLVRNSFLIFFGDGSPSPMHVRDYGPALYVYDILRGEWLPEPVSGLEKNGAMFPSLDTVRDFTPHLIRVRRDESKLAIVWSVDPSHYDEYGNYVLENTRVHWSKVILIHQVEENEPPSFRAASVSFGSFSNGETLLVNCAAG